MTKVCVEFDQGDGEQPQPAVKTFHQVIGDGAATTHTVSHGFGSADVLYAVRNLATGEVDAYDYTAVSQPDALTLTFASPLAASSARVSVLSLAAQA